jgi:hypothetical protein
MAFPAFSEYQDAFSSGLSPSVFASYTVPSWIPAPANLVRIARAIYPYWKERRMERGGHRIIPTLNVSSTYIPIAIDSDHCFSLMNLIPSTSPTCAFDDEKLRLSEKPVPLRPHHLTN